MRHYLDGLEEWSIEIPDGMAAHWTWDAFHVFERPGFKIFSAVYVDPNADPARAIREYFDSDAEKAMPFETDSPDIIGCAIRHEPQYLEALLAGNGCLIRLTFHGEDERDFDMATAILKSVKPVSQESDG